MFSVSTDMQANTAFQSAPKSTRPDPSQYTDSFSALVDAASPADPSGNAAPNSQFRSQRADSTNSASNTPSPHSDSAANQANAPGDNSAQAAAGSDKTDKTSSSDGKSDSKSDATSTAKSGDGTSVDKPSQDQTAQDDTTGTIAMVDPTALAAIQVAAVIQPSATPATAAATTTTTDATASIAAVTAAASAQATSIGPATLGIAAPGDGPAAAAANSTDGNAKATDASTKATAAATKNAATAATTTASAAAATADEAATTNPAFSAMVDAAAQTGGKTKAPAPGKAASVATADANAKTDQTGTAPQTAQSAQANAIQQPVTTDKQDGSLIVADPTKSTDATFTPAVHEHGGTSANAQGTPSLADSSLQAANALQPQLATQPTAAPVAAANLTATAATSAAVPLSGLAVEIAGSALNGKSHFEIRLDPAELGRIDVRIDVDRSGQVTSHLRVEKPETLSMLQQTAPQLQQALNDAGLKTGSGGLQFSLRDQSTSGQNGNNGQPNGNAQRLIISDEDAIPAAAAGRSYGRMLNASGGIDIRV